MSIHAGVNISHEENPEEAGYEAFTNALKNSGADHADLAVVFSSVELDQESVVRGVRRAGTDVPLVGCSDAGEITGAGPDKGKVAVMTITSDTVTFYTGLGRDVAGGAREAGQNTVRDVKAKAGADAEQLRAFVMLPDVLAGNGADIVRGVLDELGEHFPVVGGAAGDDFAFEKTYEYHNDEVCSGAVTGIGIAGDFAMGAGVRHGWLPVGVPMTVTKSEGAVVYELDGNPAVSIYEEYFGESADDLSKEPLARTAITYPLGIKYPDLDDYFIRDPITVDEKTGAITCAAEIPEGSEVRLMIGSKDKAIEAATEAAKDLMKDFERQDAKPKFAFMFNCIAREKLFGARAGEEIKAVMDVLGADVPLIGFYTYGEQAPIGGEVLDTEKIHSRFFNETMALFAIGE